MLEQKLLNFFTVLYGLQGVTLAVSYVPQFRSVWKSRTGAKDISIATWLFWTTTSIVSLVYAFAIVKDRPLIAVSATALAGCTLITLATIIRRLQYTRQRKSDS